MFIDRILQLHQHLYVVKSVCRIQVFWDCWYFIEPESMMNNIEIMCCQLQVGHTWGSTGLTSFGLCSVASHNIPINLVMLPCTPTSSDQHTDISWYPILYLIGPFWVPTNPPKKIPPLNSLQSWVACRSHNHLSVKPSCHGQFYWSVGLIHTLLSFVE